MQQSSGGCPVLHGERSMARPTGARAENRSPLSATFIDLADPYAYVLGVPHDQFRVLREEDPVFWHREVDSPGFWAVTRYDDVITASRHHREFSSAEGGVFLFDPPHEDLENMRLMMLNMDPPRHTKLRGLVNRGFTPYQIGKLEPHVREICRRIVDRVARKGRCDFVTDIAAELPLQVIAEMMGVPLEERQMVFDWSNRLIGFDDPELSTSAEDGKLAAAEMYAYSNRLAAERRQNPKDDLITILLNAEVEGEKLNELEFDLFFLLLAVAGNETTRNLISGGMLALIGHPEERARLMRDRSLLPSAIEEMLRFISPVMHFRRTAMRDFDLRDKRIREGDKIVLWYVSANRDAAVFPDPDRFDVGRNPNEHIAFGLGAHFCLGSNLARLEIRLMFEELLRRLPDLELDGEVRRLRSAFINGIKEMPVRFTPEL